MPLSERATEFLNRLFRRGRFCYTWEKEWILREKYVWMDISDSGSFSGKRDYPKAGAGE